MVNIWYPDRDDRESTGERPRAPLAFLRTIRQTILEEEPDRVVFSEEGIGRAEFRKLGSGSYSIEFGFHENNIENKFEFRPLSETTGGQTTRQGTDLPDLGGNAGEFGRLFERQFKDVLPFEFAELDAASVGHENLTSYEFKYETFVDISTIREANF